MVKSCGFPPQNRGSNPRTDFFFMFSFQKFYHFSFQPLIKLHIDKKRDCCNGNKVVPPKPKTGFEYRLENKSQ